MNDSWVIELKNVAVFQDQNKVLSGINLVVARSEFVYLIGKVGSGKSSLMKTLYADLPLREGYGNVVGYDLAKLSEENRPYLRRKVGVVFQDFQLLSDRSVYENLNFVLRATNWKKNREMRIDEVLQKVGMEHKKHEMPHKLSGGEFQRIAIARALLNNPDVILADEPTGNLDPETTHEIISLLHHLAEAGRSVLIATHEHRLISLFKGRVLECVTGTVREITSTGEPNLNSLID